MAARVAAGVWLAWAVGALELLGVVLWRQELAGVWEVQYGALWLAPTALLLAAAPGAAGGLGAALLEGEGRFGRLVTAATLGVFSAAVAAGVSSGRHFESPGIRLLFVAAVAVAGLGAAWVLGPQLARGFARRPLATTLTVGGAVAMLEIANGAVLVRLYPAFHLGLGAVCLALAGTVQLGLVREPAHGPPAGLASSVVTAAALAGLYAVAPGAAQRLQHFDNFRLVMAEHAPLLGRAVSVAASLAPAPTAGGAACSEGDCHERAETGGPRLPLAAHDVLLVTVDAVRADHVGAYGYDRGTTPRIDALAEGGAVFEHAYCSSPHTSYSVTSLLTGKYMRPLLLQGAGQDSDTLATLLRRYEYRTAAFYPPAVFFIDRGRFGPLEQSGLGFEYRKVEFLEGRGRVDQVEQYLAGAGREGRLFLWVHLFGPHEPYESHADHAFGDKDVDRYDSEIAAADETVGQIVDAVRARRDRVLVVVTSDHGEEFGDHGGRYHGTTVYEEQVRVPLILNAPGVVARRRIAAPVQTIDVMPTILEGLEIPVPPRVRGTSLAPLLSDTPTVTERTAFAETDGQTLLARGTERLVCDRDVGACRLFDLDEDPAETRDLSSARPQVARDLHGRLDRLTASHGAFERQGLRAEGKGWPPAILRGIAGDADAAPGLAALLDDADVTIRRKAAELSFELGRAESTPALRLSLQRDEDEQVRRWSALALTRLGEGAPLVRELLRAPDSRWRRLAALALAEAGDKAGNDILVDWWMRDPPDDHRRSLDLVAAFGRLRSRKAVWPLVQRLGDVRLRPDIARALARIGDDTARGPLVRALSRERYQGARQAMAEALVDLGAREELAAPLIRFLGTPDPLQQGLGVALRAGISEHVGGPPKAHLRRLDEEAHVGTVVRIVVPRGGNGSGLRLLLRGRSSGVGAGEVRVGRAEAPIRYDSKGKPIKRRKLPTIHPTQQLAVRMPAANEPVEVHARIPASMGLRPRLAVDLVVFAERDVSLEGLAVVPLSDELPPPPPEPWAPGADVPDAGASP